MWVGWFPRLFRSSMVRFMRCTRTLVLIMGLIMILCFVTMCRLLNRCGSACRMCLLGILSFDEKGCVLVRAIDGVFSLVEWCKVLDSGSAYVVSDGDSGYASAVSAG